MYGATTSRRLFPLPRRGVSAITAIFVGCVIVAGCAGQKGSTSATREPSARPTSSGTIAAGTLPGPVLAASPRIAAMPGTRTPASTGSPAPAAGHSTAGSPGSSGAASSSPAAPAPATCTHPQYTTSDQYGMWQLPPYYVYNDMWAVQGYQVTQTLYACSYSDWYVVADMNNDTGDGHVKTFPNSHRDWDSEPQINSLSSVTSSFAISGTPPGIYEYAYDIWVNGIATASSTEVMIWTYNHGQTPSGSVVAHVTLGGQSYQVWKYNNYIAFVADHNFTSGTMDLLQFFNWIIGQGWLTTSATLGQVDYGVELVSTDNVPETFSFSNFSVNAS
jgi:hypothetical protein